jgi:hypothetical protein
MRTGPVAAAGVVAMQGLGASLAAAAASPAWSPRRPLGPTPGGGGGRLG